MSFEEQMLINNTINIGEAFLSHAGKKGMKWGKRKPKEYEKVKDSFARDVRQTRRGQGLQRKVEISKNGSVTTSYRDSNRKKVGKEYAESVIARSLTINNRHRRAKSIIITVGALYVARSLIR